MFNYLDFCEIHYLFFRFRGRPGASTNRFKTSASSTTAVPEIQNETGKKPGRFGNRGFSSRTRPGPRTTTEATEPEATKEEHKPSHARVGKTKYA